MDSRQVILIQFNGRKESLTFTGRNRMKRYRLLLLFVLLVIPAIACQLATQLTDQISNSGDAVFRDDFSKPYSGWLRGTDLPNGGISDYADGRFRILVNESNYDYWSIPKLRFDDTRIEVDAIKLGGPEFNRFGLMCRYQDEKNYYFFIISSDGYYGVGMVKDDRISLIGMDEMLPSNAILAGTGLNHLRADCVGNEMTFFVNGQQVARVNDSQYTSGDVGILAGTFDEPGVDVVFDNFVVVKP
jgi:hypothetical protein